MSPDRFSVKLLFKSSLFIHCGSFRAGDHSPLTQVKVFIVDSENVYPSVQNT